MAPFGRSHIDNRATFSFRKLIISNEKITFALRNQHLLFRMEIRNLKNTVALMSLAVTTPAIAQKAPATPPKQAQPNVLIIYADDLGYGDLECYGAKNVATPNVNRIAQNGIRFTNAYAVAATSTPSRYAMLTGHYSWRRPDTDLSLIHI